MEQVSIVCTDLNRGAIFSESCLAGDLPGRYKVEDGNCVFTVPVTSLQDMTRVAELLNYRLSWVGGECDGWVEGEGEDPSSSGPHHLLLE